MGFPFRLPARYEYEGPRLDGGQGKVYVCRDKYLDRKVAIKVLDGLSDATQIKKEFGTIEAVQSRHVARKYDLVESQRQGATSAIGFGQGFIPGEFVTRYAKAGAAGQSYLLVLYQIACGISDIHAS